MVSEADSAYEPMGFRYSAESDFDLRRPSFLRGVSQEDPGGESGSGRTTRGVPAMGALVVDAEMRRMMEIRDPGCGLPVQVETSGVNLVEGVGPSAT